MNKDKLRSMVKKAINELINEDPASDQNAINAEKSAVDAKIVALQKKKVELAKQNSTLAEMSRTPIQYDLADDYQNKLASLPYIDKPKRMFWINGIIDYISGNGPADITKIAREKFNKPQPIIADYARDLIRSGILIPTQAGVVPQFMRQAPVAAAPTIPGEEGDEEDNDIDEPTIGGNGVEDMFMGGGNGSLSAYFDDVPNNDGSEDFNDEEEPTIDVDGETVPAAQIPDDDFEAYLKYDKLNQFLINTKSNIQKLKRDKSGSSAGDVRDVPSDEIERLRTLKASLESRINDLVQSSPYLQAKINSPEIEEPEIEEPEELDEWTINKLKYYAGITK